MSCFVIAFIPLTLSAQMKEVSEIELSQISAQSGISINLDMVMNITYPSIRFSDTDSTPKMWIEFNNMQILGYKMSTPLPDAPILLDIATADNIDATHRTFVNYLLSQTVSPQTWDIGNIVFCNQDIGSIQLANIQTADPTVLRLSGHSTGAGLELEYLTNLMVSDISYKYNSSGDALHLSGLRLAESANSVNDDPSNPSTWQFTGKFRIGDLFGGVIGVDNSGNASVPNPATLDVGTDSSGSTALYINLPMKGTARIADVNFGGNDFGPVAIDGITVHHLCLKINPNN
jgi:hypothetical protein